MRELKKTISALDSDKLFAENVLNANNILGFKDIENKDRFMLAVALGLNSPCEKDKLKGASGWFRTEVIKHINEKANYQVILLGKASSEDIEEAIDLQNNFDMSERCAVSGFEKLREMADIYRNDNDLICKKFIKDLDLLYEKYFKM